MELIGVVAEFNPFHNGHEKLLKEVRKRNPLAVIAVVMSGPFTQRGELAVFDKWTRTRVALNHGADLVFELPQSYATASLEYFAKGAVETLLATGSLTGLAFGSESGDVVKLRKLSAVLRDEPPAFAETFKASLAAGNSYAQAQQEALLAFDDAAPGKNEANDRLALHYLAHLPKECEAIAIERDTVHDAENPESHEASAQFIRKALYKNQEISLFVPKKAFEIYQEVADEGWHLAQTGDYYLAMMTRLLALNEAELAQTLGIKDGFEHRLIEMAKASEDYYHLLGLAQTKQYTRARIARMLLELISPSAVSAEVPPAYLRLLGMNGLGQLALKSIRKRALVPILNALGRDGRRLPRVGQQQLEMDVARQDLASLLQRHRKFRYLGLDYQMGPMIERS